ncbi:DNA recombination-dependent growth factor C [Vibrio phage 51E28.1]|nr:DNA recombination-dependent growth factor C [Vibrio phage 51E28.4]QZI92876.1 DNA recombination-dependent growth factor C [Vibrio phage 51E28.1]
MFFKNALVYRFNREIKFDAAQLETQLKEFMFTPCGEKDKQKFGWVEPMGRFGGQAMTHVGNGNILLTAQLQVKNVPSKNLAKAVKERVDKIEAVEGRPLKKIERDSIRDDAFNEMLPRAFETDTYSHLLIMPALNLIVVDATSYNKAEDALALLRKTIGSLPVVPVVPKSAVETIMTQWIKTGETPAGITALDKIVLSSIVDQGGKATLAKQDLSADEVKNHIEANKVVTSLELNWQDRISFKLSDDFSIKTLKWSDELKDENDDIPREDEIARFDADFVLACGEFAAFLPQLFEAFDGLAETAVAGKASYADCLKEEPLVEHAIELAVETRRASVSAIQRKFKIGYNRAARIMEMLEALEIVSAPGHSGTREVLVSDQKEEVDNA